MAYADYTHCAVCDAKAFYDANLNWDTEGGVQRLDYCGALAALCDDCAKEWELVRVKRRTPHVEGVEYGAEVCESALAAERGVGRDEMTFAAFSAENRARCEAPNGFNHPVGSWSLSDWMTATMGELGEAANAAKKLNRVRDGIVGNDETEAELRANFADELADTFIYLDLLAQSQGIDLAAAVRAKFDRTSKKIGYTPPAEVSRACSQCGSTVQVADSLCFACYHADGTTPTPEASRGE